MVRFSSMADLLPLIGSEVGVSEWLEITQERIDQFAAATGDFQWIHVDVARSHRESPYGVTVAHGFLTLGLLPVFLSEAVQMDGVGMMVNYGANRVRFPAPLLVGSRVQGRFKLLAIEEIPGGTQIEWEVTVEREGGDKPVCVAQILVRFYV
jgi:acyl dehydratase